MLINIKITITVNILSNVFLWVSLPYTYITVLYIDIVLY